jgi:arylsulfatase A-like enzyme
MKTMKTKIKSTICSALLCAAFATGAVAADKPNILFIMSDDVGVSNISAYSHGVMGYKTPNIDSLARKGAMFTDFYAEQSCTAGRAAFITGQYVYRTGLSTVGMPAAPQGIQDEDVTLATLLKEQGYATGQFGKNHLGDRNEFLPTVHGFAEFFGLLYHLNAMEEPFTDDYPPADLFPEFYPKFGPREVVHSWATDKNDTTMDPRFGKVGKQRIEGQGPLPPHPTEGIELNMETFDDVVTDKSIEFMKRAVAADEPFFVWHNPSAMHEFSHISKDIKGQAGIWQSEYHDRMVEHDKQIGRLLDELEALGVADNTIVIYTADNGAMVGSKPDGGTTPFRGEKDTSWEGGFRAPMVMRWPGTIEPGLVSNEIVSMLDFFPTLMDAVGNPNIVDELKKGYKADNGMKYKVHLDGTSLKPYLSGETETHDREGFIYFADTGDVFAVRFNNWKFLFIEQPARGTYEVWMHPFNQLRVPKIFNLRTDPFETADFSSNTYWDFINRHTWMMPAAMATVGGFIKSLEEFPRRQDPPSFDPSAAMQKLEDASKKN